MGLPASLCDNISKKRNRPTSEASKLRQSKHPGKRRGVGGKRGMTTVRRNIGVKIPRDREKKKGEGSLVEFSNLYIVSASRNTVNQLMKP
jgi:hypothetical protein